MKRIALILLVAVLVVSCVAAVPSPATVAWDSPADGFADSYEVAIERNGTDTIIGSPTNPSFLVDLAVVGVYGRYVVKVRSVTDTDGELDYSAWIRSDADADVITVDGVPQTFTILRKRPAGVPTMLRVQ